ncbi:PP2C family protein-serine/threonine phosphatase [Streptomyces sp. NPDC032198]|uniref:PP2C family protein-serine/threonine phosphatase n=1 Tax=Streptomyces sp. NPDC032198 TaxID=3155127 RepID=UPI0033D22B4B
MAIREGWRERWGARVSRVLPLTVCSVLAAPGIFAAGWEPAAAMLLIGPMASCVRHGVRHTAATAGWTVLLAVTAGVTRSFPAAPGPPFLVEFLVLLAGGALAVVVAARQSAGAVALARATEVARAAQGAILRPVSEQIGGIDVCTRHHCPVQGATVAGDVYDIAHTPYGLRVFMGDVRGHDLEALRISAGVIGAFRDLAYTTPRLPDLARALDARITPELGPEDFVTAVFAEFAPGEVRLVNCGHPAPLRVGQRVKLLEPPSPAVPLGLGSKPVMHRGWLQPGDRMLFYTDGLSEARDADGADFPLSEGAADALAEPLASDALDALYARVTEHTGAPLADDVALMLCQPAEPTGGCAVPDPVCLAPANTFSSPSGSSASSASGDR